MNNEKEQVVISDDYKFAKDYEIGSVFYHMHTGKKAVVEQGYSGKIFNIEHGFKLMRCRNLMELSI